MRFWADSSPRQWAKHTVSTKHLRAPDDWHKCGRIVGSANICTTQDKRPPMLHAGCGIERKDTNVNHGHTKVTTSNIYKTKTTRKRRVDTIPRINRANGLMTPELETHCQKMYWRMVHVSTRIETREFFCFLAQFRNVRLHGRQWANDSLCRTTWKCQAARRKFRKVFAHSFARHQNVDNMTRSVV